MNGSDIFSNEYFRIFHNADGVFIESFKKGFSSGQLIVLINSHPEISLSSLSALITAVNAAPRPPEKIGILKEPIAVEISEDGLRAAVTFNLPQSELTPANRAELIKQTLDKLKQKNIVYGIKPEVLNKDLHPGKAYAVSEGLLPLDGKDSVIKLYELKDSRPEIHQDGKADYYELRLINRVKPGDWLGERLDATPGTPGRSVLGLPIKPYDGKTLPLNYDKTTIREVYENGRTTLYSRISGAVNYTDGRITVSNHLDIDGDVDFRTGNIKFDGYVTIRGTVADGFSVEAAKDIEINSPLGLGHVKGILSTTGSIYIKGGIASKSPVEIKAAQSVFTRFADNAVITCGETANMGFYCINSTVTAREVLVESPNGHIIGGKITAEVRIAAANIGSEIEKKTILEVKGFDREMMKQELDGVFQKISILKNDQQRAKQVIAQLEGVHMPTPAQRKEKEDSFELLSNAKIEIKELEEKRRIIANYLKTRGEGEISIGKKAYPNVILSIKGIKLEIPSVTSSCTYYVQDEELKQL